MACMLEIVLGIRHVQVGFVLRGLGLHLSSTGKWNLVSDGGAPVLGRRHVSIWLIRAEN